MQILVISASPNRDGLTAACAAAAVEGIRAAGVSAEEVRLNDRQIGLCRACDDGWGPCREEHWCQMVDDFQTIHACVRQAEGYVLVTPVYWWEMSEVAKAFLDRLRRCEAPRGEQSALYGKPILSVAAAGGSGNGTLPCLLSMERFTKHVRARVFDLIPVTRWTRPYKLEAIGAAAQAMATTLRAEAEG